MSGLKLKVCGMKFPDNISEVSALQPDYLGFIFYERSPRNFTGDISAIPEGIKKTGVFVDADIDFILQKLGKYQFSAVQLHGEESPEFCEKLMSSIEKQGLTVETIKVFSIKDSFDFARLQPYEGKVDYFLFDTQGKNKGGNGICFDWEVLKDYPSSTPFFLSGGIGPEEIGEIEEFHNYLKNSDRENLLLAVDVNSRFEISPGLKDAASLRSFQKKLQFKNTGK